MEYIKSLFCIGCEDPQLKLSRSKMMLMISIYNLDYDILDKSSNEVVNCDLIDFDQSDHIIKINDNKFDESDFYI